MKYLILWKGQIPLDIIVEKILREHSNGISCSVIFFKHYPTVGHIFFGVSSMLQGKRSPRCHWLNLNVHKIHVDIDCGRTGRGEYSMCVGLR